MATDLHQLKIDKSLKTSASGDSNWAAKWILAGVVLFLLLGAARYLYEAANREVEVQTVRVASASASSGAGGASSSIVLNATGYIIAHHKIQLAAKVVGKVAWIGVEKGDKVKEGQILVRLEDDEYRAQLAQAKGQLANLEARLAELSNGSRPEEVQVARANLEQAKADLANSKVTLDRTRGLVAQKVLSAQALDDAQAKYDGNAARVASLERSFELVRLGPRQEQIDQARGQVVQAKGGVDFAQTQLDNTVVRAPITGTILERAVEKGEFVTTSFVGDRGAKGYVVSIADLNDLQVELDINQSDFARLGPQQRGIITTDAYPDRKYAGAIEEVSPEANRQKATVQVKVKVLKPDEFLRPEMNASVAFINEEKPVAGNTSEAKPVVFVPSAAVREGAVFVYLNGKAVRRAVKTAGITAQGLRVEDGLIGGEDIILNPAPELKDGARVRKKT